MKGKEFSKRSTSFLGETLDTQADREEGPARMNPSMDVSDVKVRDTSAGGDIARGYTHVQFGERPTSTWEVRDQVNPWKPKGRS